MKTKNGFGVKRTFFQLRHNIFGDEITKNHEINVFVHN